MPNLPSRKAGAIAAQRLRHIGHTYAALLRRIAVGVPYAPSLRAVQFDGLSLLISFDRLGLHDRSGCDRGRGQALTDYRRGPVQVLTQPFAYLVNILSRRFANDCRSLLVKAGGPPVYIPLARNVSMKSRMLSR